MKKIVTTIRRVSFPVLGLFLGLTYLEVDLSHAEGSSLPSGPKGPGRFGAYYTRLNYDAAWEEPWRVGSHADVVLRFENGGHKFVFWRGTSYVPCWVSANDIWYTNEFVERHGADSPNTKGSVEPISDKQSRFSHVRIIENTDARVVIHWRYAPVDVGYNHPFIEPSTGWSDWVDEYHTIYPDAVGVRKITAYTSRPDLWMEWQESIVINPPGTMPEDNIELGAITVANMQGESKTYSWTKEGSPQFIDPPKGVNIVKVNLKSIRKPFVIVPPNPDQDRVMITPYKGHGEGSYFHFWDHWPVSQTASDRRLATSSDRPSHSSLCHIGLKDPLSWMLHDAGDNWLSKIMLHGMTEKLASELVPLAKSWHSAPAIEARSGCKMFGYDKTKREYPLVATGQNMSLAIDASEEHPIVNPCFTIRNWGPGTDATVLVNGNEPKEVRQGTITDTDGRQTMVIWIKLEGSLPTQFTISGATPASDYSIPESLFELRAQSKNPQD